MNMGWGNKEEETKHVLMKAAQHGFFGHFTASRFFDAFNGKSDSHLCLSSLLPTTCDSNYAIVSYQPNLELDRIVLPFGTCG